MTPASRATASIDTAWYPEAPKARRATWRSCARRSGARIRRRGEVEVLVTIGGWYITDE